MIVKLLPTPQKILDAADRAEDKYLNALENAPTKSGWNRTFGIRIPSKYDALREYNQTMKGLQELCESRGYEGIIEPKVEEVPVTRVNREQS
jgi:hypothetical protein